MSQAEILPEDPDREAALAYGRELEIAALRNSPALKLLLSVMEEAEEEWAQRVGRNILTSTKEVDQRQLDFTRGYFSGARYWLQGRVTLAETRVKQHAEEQAGQTDPRPTGRHDPRIEGVEDA